MSRAQKFYETLLQIKLNELPMPDSLGGMQMLSFPWAENDRNISGALVKMENMGLVAGGTLVYFASEDCSIEEGRAEAAGGKCYSPKCQWLAWILLNSDGYGRKYDWIAFDALKSFY